MQAHELRSPTGARKRKIIVGRGKGSGHGKTCGRGHKGQKARSGRGILGGLEGGQMPLIRRIPKLGFRSHRPLVYQCVSLAALARAFPQGGTIRAESLEEKGLIKNRYKPYKILAQGEVTVVFDLEAYAFSEQARSKIEKANGRVTLITAADLKKRADSGQND